MATKYGTNYQKEFVNVPAERANAAQYAGSIRTFQEEFVLTEALADGDVVKLFKMSSAGKIVGGFIKSDDLGATGIVKLGTEADDDGLIAAGDISDASGTPISVQFDAKSTLLGEALAVGDEIVMTCTEVSAATSGTIKVVLFVAEA